MSIHHPYQRKNILEIYDDIWMVDISSFFVDMYILYLNYRKIFEI